MNNKNKSQNAKNEENVIEVDYYRPNSRNKSDIWQEIDEYRLGHGENPMADSSLKNLVEKLGIKDAY